MIGYSARYGTLKQYKRLSMIESKDPSERRAHSRALAAIAVKLRRSARTLFTGGRTLDVSSGGASLELYGPREAIQGERIAIAFENMNCPVTRAAKMIGASVVRVEPLRDGRQRVAVCFDSPQTSFEGIGYSAAA